MCGILAVLCKNKEDESTINELYKSYDEVLYKRGSDAGNFCVSDEHITGFTRLSINDTSAKGNQPFYLHNDSGENILLLCNGEIWNHKQLEKEYNIECASKSDCHCIIYLYKKLGFQKMVTLLDGDFALIIIDSGKMYIARDRIGIRPLFYGTTTNGNIAVASVALALTNLCDDVQQFVPGYAEYSEGKFTRYEYEYPVYNINTILSERSLLHDTINDTLTLAIRKRLISDRPIGCLLSGGLDSSLVASILCKLIGSQNVRTYSIGMKGSEDLKYARIVADFLNTQHTELLFTPQEGFDAIPDIIRDLESYDITTIRASVGMWLLAQYISTSTTDKVIFSGEGSDELLAGYLYFKLAPNATALDDETKRLVKNLYKYDVLRADRCISSHTLELRVPFLDRDMINLGFNIPGELKKPIDGIEKHILRRSFAEGRYLPSEVLNRSKVAFSDGVSDDSGKKWYQMIQSFVDEKITDAEFAEYKNLYPSKEAYYYKKIFDSIFPKYQPKMNYWLPKWIDTNGEPSATVLPNY
uniref:asparagine synthase (glutamine-hydrolyzing) n=1 Tax=viral metagenome TaxID=1070528 RepID=A0A6C0CZR7_9ZZZZ